ncbi:hypothetical protein [Saccharopolyspora spinosa]|uniref:Uncharacterized protein n=1 Tax=Saccharopolyspora spinosa TaxID=60894 RepID=A0A2N3XZ15_SACSN|nr:hypothetical protein [Saccharopolyspora spinosa]PKW15915.1 hypothetical protein A8926_3697 [Saccharopolyspora spinosa]
MNNYRWLASTGIIIALVSACVHYTVTTAASPPQSVVGYLDRLGPLLQLLFGTTALLLVLALVSGRGRHGAHALAAGCLSGYAAALWATAILSVSTRGIVTAGLATALAIHALLLASAYSKRGTPWTRH